MAYAHPILILLVALVASWLGWPRGRADLRVHLRRLIRSLARPPAGPAPAAAQGLGLAALGALCGAVTVWLLVAQVAFLLRAVLPYQAAVVAEILISGLLLALTLDLRCLLAPNGHDVGDDVQAAGLRWTRGVVTPLLLYAVGGLYGPLIYLGALETWKLLESDARHAALSGWAQRPVALAHYLPARIGALAASVAGRAVADLWQRDRDLWHGEWVAGAMRGARARPERLLAWATLVVLTLVGLMIWWPGAPS